MVKGVLEAFLGEGVIKRALILRRLKRGSKAKVVPATR